MITVTVTGNLADDPHPFRLRDGLAGCDLRLAVDIPPRSATDESPTRYLKVTALGVMASHAIESLHKGDRVTVHGTDLTAEAWSSPAGEPRAKVCIRAIEIAASLRFDSITTGRATRAKTTSGRPATAAEAAEREVLAGVTR
jgi:single-stranded DNA-binding protein